MPTLLSSCSCEAVERFAGDEICADTGWAHKNQETKAAAGPRCGELGRACLLSFTLQSCRTSHIIGVTVAQMTNDQHHMALDMPAQQRHRDVDPPVPQHKGLLAPNTNDGIMS
jgi:hypothetical protein